MLGGFQTRRELLTEGDYGLFEKAINEAIGDRVRESEDDAIALWSALANIIWISLEGKEATYSFRAAGDLIAAISKTWLDMEIR